MKNLNLKNVVVSSIIGLGTLAGGIAFAQDSSDMSPSNDQTTTPSTDGTTTGTSGGTQGGNSGY